MRSSTACLGGRRAVSVLSSCRPVPVTSLVHLPAHHDHGRTSVFQGAVGRLHLLHRAQLQRAGYRSCPARRDQVPPWWACQQQAEGRECIYADMTHAVILVQPRWCSGYCNVSCSRGLQHCACHPPNCGQLGDYVSGIWGAHCAGSAAGDNGRTT